jgi:hypothetical protein
MSGAMKYARVVDVLDSENVVLNVGQDQGVSVGSKFLLYASSRDVKDMDGRSLGTLEITKGYGKVIHVQATMCIVKSDTFSSGFEALTSDILALSSLTLVTQKGQFLQVKRGDFARPV